MEKVSIIIPCYNMEKTMLRTLNSIREQEYSNLEAIIINDGSTDNTKDIANKYLQIDNRFKMIDVAHEGVSNARNVGLNSCTGDYVTFIDGDDNYTTPYAISTMIKAIQEANADVCACNFNNKWLNSYYYNAKFNLKDKSEFLKYYQTDVGVVWNKLYKKTCITKKFHTDLLNNEDKIFNLENLANCMTAVTISDNLLNYISKKDIELVDVYNLSGSESILNDIFMQSFSDKLMKYKMSTFKKLKINENIMCDCDLVNEFFHDLSLLYFGDVADVDLIRFCNIHLRKKEFLNLFKRKSSFGLKFLGMSKDKIDQYEKLISYAYNDVITYNKKLSTYLISISLFVKIFFELTDNTCDDDLFVAMAKTKTCPEVKYAENILELCKLNLL